MGAKMMRRVLLLLGLMLVTMACCNGKKLWGVDVGNKEEDGQFESLLAAQKASRTAGDPYGAGQALGMLKDIDMSKLSLSEICTYLIDVAIDILQDSETMEPFAEPGVIRELLDNAGLEAMLEDDTLASAERDDLVTLLALENNAVLYRTKFAQLLDKAVGKLISLRLDVVQPAKLRSMLRDLLKSAGFEREQINQTMELLENPQMLASQLEVLLNDPAVTAEITKAMDMFTQTQDLLGDAEIDEAQLIKMMNALEENPELAEEMFDEMMKDPTMAEVLKLAGLGNEEGASVGGVPAGDKGKGGGDFFNAGGRRGAQTEL